jgi:inosine/xanthosine triphosphate pyrophosphatase family protein
MRRINYVTSNKHKHEEIAVFRNEAQFVDGVAVRDVFEFQIREVSIPERLEIDLKSMVRHEVTRAYEVLKVPCLVEHAGLVLDGFESAEFPGGLTKPMWNALRDGFSREMRVDHKGATAKAVVAYCDGMDILVFVGETHGRLAEAPRGSRTFYWDTIFIPDDPKRPDGNLTYAEIVAEASMGLRYKVIELSQSTKAMTQCLQFIRDTSPNRLWV